MRSAEWGGRAVNNTAKQARTLGGLLLVTERCKMTELGTEAFGFGYVAMLDSIPKNEIRLLNLVNQVVSLGHCHTRRLCHTTSFPTTNDEWLDRPYHP